MQVPKAFPKLSCSWVHPQSLDRHTVFSGIGSSMTGCPSPHGCISGMLSLHAGTTSDLASLGRTLDKGLNQIIFDEQVESLALPFIGSGKANAVAVTAPFIIRQASAFLTIPHASQSLKVLPKLKHAQHTQQQSSLWHCFPVHDSCLTWLGMSCICYGIVKLLTLHTSRLCPAKRLPTTHINATHAAIRVLTRAVHGRRFLHVLTHFRILTCSYVYKGNEDC